MAEQTQGNNNKPNQQPANQQQANVQRPSQQSSPQTSSQQAAAQQLSALKAQEDRRPPVPSNDPPNQTPTQAKADEAPGVHVTYVPGPGDQAVTEWNGHVFHANKPRKVVDEKMIEQAKGNPWFHVEGHDKADGQDDGMPHDSEGYRKYAIGWINGSRSSAEMLKRWNAEEGLRKRCGFGSDDDEYLEKPFQTKLADLKRAES